MSETNRPRRTGRSIVAVLVGILVGAIPSILTDKVLQTTGVFPPSSLPMGDALLLLATGYRTIYSVAGSYFTARLAPHRPMTHAMALGAMGCALGIVGLVVTWGRPDVVGHEWYPLALVVLAMPQSWLGGRLREMQLSVRVDG